MANLSNINNILRISSSGVGLNKDNTGPSELDIESAGADIIDMTRTGQKTYRFAISGASAFSLFDVAANADRLVIDSSGNSTFAGNVTASAFLTSNGSFTQNGFWGATINAGSGSFADFALLNSATAGIMYNPTGTLNMVFQGNVGIGVTPNNGNGGLEINKTGGTFANANQKRVASFYDGSVNANNPGIVLGYDDSSTPHGIVAARTQTPSGTIPGLQFFTYDGGWGPRMTILNTGNVGIGTTSPSATEPIGGNLPTGWTRANSRALEIAAPDFANSGLFLRNSGTTATGTDITGDQYFGDTYIDNRYNNDNGSIYFRTKTAVSPQIRMAIKGSGNVGIGTTSPNNLLNLSRNVANGDVAAYIQNFNADTGSTNETASLKFAHGNDGVVGYVGGKLVCGKEGDFETSIANIKGNLQFYTASGTSLDSDVNNIERMRITSGGNVGIGTNSPTEKLHIKSTTSGSFIRFEDNGGSGVYVGSRSNDLEFYAGNSEKMVILSGGNVGIGITNPQDKLHVNGDAIISSTRFGDFAVGSLNTTGYAIANVAASTNGQSAIVEFVASGNNGGYYNVVYSCYNGGGVWYYTKNVVGTGGNIEVAETNGSGSSTLVFYFRATSGGASYTPRVMMKGMPYNLVTF